MNSVPSPQPRNTVTKQRRRSRFTREEMAKVLADRDAHPDMTVLQWAQQYPISTSLFYKFQERLGKKKKKMGRPVGSKNKVTRTPKGKPSNTTAAFAHAVGQIKHWRGEATRLAEQLIHESLTE